jgi:hypothetical protein
MGSIFSAEMEIEPRSKLLSDIEYPPDDIVICVSQYRSSAAIENGKLKIEN